MQIAPQVTLTICALTLEQVTKNILIVGGGTAGWLTAAILASEHSSHHNGLTITVVESSTKEPIGVGEGTWPSMRDTLQEVGVSEHDFINACNVTFKQGSKFIDWHSIGHSYYHPFTLPAGYLTNNLVPYWQERADEPFSYLFCSQPIICENGLAPKQSGTPEYAGVTNYGYHLDAGKFAAFLREHCVKRLNVKHIVDDVQKVVADDAGYLTSVVTKKKGGLTADLFIDCTGSSARLIGQHYGVPLKSQQRFLFNDSALAVRVPYQTTESPIASATLSVAQQSGWIWDIGTSNRRGTGYSYSSAHQSDVDAEQCLIDYHKKTSPHIDANALELKKISYTGGYRSEFWHKNCVAIGMSAGFIEPLEASAIAMIEKAASILRDELPKNRRVMPVLAQRFNQNLSYRWERIVDFLKLHYVLTTRDDSAYWRDNTDAKTIPTSLQELLELWRYHEPSRYDFCGMDEVFPSASYQYVLYGMLFKTESRQTSAHRDDRAMSMQHVEQTYRLLQKQLAGLPRHRELIKHIHSLQQ